MERRSPDAKVGQLRPLLPRRLVHRRCLSTRPPIRDPIPKRTISQASSARPGILWPIMQQRCNNLSSEPLCFQYQTGHGKEVRHIGSVPGSFTRILHIVQACRERNRIQ